MLRRKYSIRSDWHSVRWLPSAATTRPKITVCATCCWCHSVMHSPPSTLVSSFSPFWDSRRPSIQNDAMKSKIYTEQSIFRHENPSLISCLCLFAVIKLLCWKWAQYHRWILVNQCTKEYWVLRLNNMEMNRWHWVSRRIAVWNINWARQPKALDWHSLCSHKPSIHCRPLHFGLCYFLRCYCRSDWAHRLVCWKEWFVHCSTSTYSKDCANNTLRVNCRESTQHFDSIQKQPHCQLIFIFSAAALCIFCFIVGLIFCTGAGEYWLKLFDSFAGTIGLVVIALLEMIAVIYIYGHEK